MEIDENNNKTFNQPINCSSGDHVPFNKPISYSSDDHITLIEPNKLIINNRTKRIVRKSKVDIVRTEKQVLRNERERCRKARLNTAFNILRRTLPSSTSNSNEEFYFHKPQEIKYTQLEVLKVASNYISQLTQLLDSLPDEDVVH